MKALATRGRLAALWLGATLAAASGGRAVESYVQSDEDRRRIEQALPPQAIAPPAKARRLLIFTRNVGYPGHPSIAFANEAFTLMGRRTGAFEAVVSDQPSIFERESLKRFDAVFFNNTVGNCFTNADLRQNLIAFVTGGGGLLGVHGTTVAFMNWPGATEDWPEFGYLIGARGANHKDSDEHVWMRLDDPDHPVTRVFGGVGFDYRDEFFRPQGTYSRDRVRVLLSIDTARTDVSQGQPRGDCTRPDNDYAVAWVRNYGRGRVFYSTIAHNPYVFWDARMLQFYLAAVQFALGDLPAPTTPSARLTPAVRAQERLGWRLGLEPDTAANLTFFAAADLAARAGALCLGGSGSQRVSEDVARKLNPTLTDDELAAIRLKLESAGLRLVSHEVESFPTEEGGCRQLFEFCRKLGIEVLVAAPPPSSLDLAEKFCEQYGVSLALKAGGGQPSPYSGPEEVLAACQGRSMRLGACGDDAAWRRDGVDPVAAVRALNHRLITLRLHGQDAGFAQAGRAGKVLAEVHRLGLRPRMIALVPPGRAAEAGRDLAEAVREFNRQTIHLESPSSP